MDAKKIAIMVGIASLAGATWAADPAPATDRLKLGACKDTAVGISLIDAATIKDDKTLRVITQGEGQEIYFLFKGIDSVGTVTGTVAETERKSRITQEAKDVIGTILGQKGVTIKSLETGIPVESCYLHIEKNKRGTLAVKIKQIPPAANADAVTGNYSGKILIGPTEHFNLSADMPVTNIKQLTYDSGSGTVIEKEKPASFYLGLNARWGDVYTNYETLGSYWKGISLKGLVKASSRPSESMGVGLSFPVPKVGPLEFFVARVWTKDDQSVGGASLGKTGSTVWGLSFNVPKGLEWFKGD